jgi:hypothetical protein
MPEPVAAETPAANPPPTQVAATPPAAAEQPAQQGKNVVLPIRVFSERLKKAETKGRLAFQAELDKQATERGFADHAAMLQHLDALRAAPKGQRAQPPVPPATTEQPPLPPKNRNDRQAMAKYEQEKAKWKRADEQRERVLTIEKQRRRKAENRANAIEAKANLERIAFGCGIRDTDYAITLYLREQEGKSEEELAKLDEKAYFNGLRENHPHLFGEVTVPATTGTTGAVPGSHTAPRSGATAAAAGSAGKVDVMSMTKQQFEVYKRNKGLRSASTGLG